MKTGWIRWSRIPDLKSRMRKWQSVFLKRHLNKSQILEQSNQKNQKWQTDKIKRCRSVSRWKAAGIIIAVAAALMIPTVTYATITGRISGAFWPSPEVEKMIDRENPVREPLDVPETEVETDQFANSSILNENSYPHPELLGIVTDVAMEPVNEGYFLSGIVFDRENTMVLTKEDGEGWQLEEGDELSISVSIDTEFAASEEDGEYISFWVCLEWNIYRSIL